MSVGKEDPLPVSQASARRQVLIAKMQELQQQGMNCSSCTGLCCTSAANSMQITDEEANDIVEFLRNSALLTAELIEKLSVVVVRYRLDTPPPGNGMRSFLRRTYTCPFYEADSGWCQLPLAAKPYGCLAFNPKLANSVGGESCGSNQVLLDEQSMANRNSRLVPNGELPELPLRDRLPIPVALLSLLQKLGK